VYGRRSDQEVCMAVLKAGAWPWLIVGVVLIVIGAVVLDGGVGTIVLACGLIALLGAGIRLTAGTTQRLRRSVECQPDIPASDCTTYFNSVPRVASP
jgi:hypothetical protein